MPLYKASIRLKPGTYGTFTETNGGFILHNVTPGKYTLEISLVGHYTIEQ